VRELVFQEVHVTVVGDPLLVYEDIKFLDCAFRFFNYRILFMFESQQHLIVGIVLHLDILGLPFEFVYRGHQLCKFANELLHFCVYVVFYSEASVLCISADVLCAFYAVDESLFLQQ
jgi:hypothetical protein